MTRFVTLDVRPLIAKGEEPLGRILKTIQALDPDQDLRLLAPFRPVPLFKVLERMGFAHEAQRLEQGDWQVDFTRAPSPLPQLEEGSALAAADWPAATQSLDLSGRTPEESASRILAALDGCRPGEVVFALLDQKPVALLARLAARGDAWAGNYAAGGQGFRILLRRG